MMNKKNKIKVRFPIKRTKGGQAKDSMKLYLDSLQNFADDLQKIQNKLDFHMGGRDWCYALEPYGLSKGNFNWMQEQINEARIQGFLMMGFILEEEGHEVEHITDWNDSEKLFIDYEYDKWKNAEKTFKDSWSDFDISFWDDQKYYIQLLVEKGGLKSLFRDICVKYKINMANTRGWGSMEQKAKMAQNFKAAEKAGKIPVLFACGDFDPAGLKISSILKETFKKYEKFSGWDSKNLIVERIGLNYNFIQQHKLTWIKKLETISGLDMSNPKHKFWKSNTYDVQGYVKKYGKRKCEANAIVVIPELGRKMLVDRIENWLGKECLKEYEEKLWEKRQEVKEMILEKYNED